MTDLYLSGPDALRLLTDFGVNSFAAFAPGKAKQYVAVNADGQFIGDAILFYLEDGLFDVVGHPSSSALPAAGSGHGMAGHPGFEVFGPWADGADVLAAILEAGREHGIIRAGAKAYSTANLEPGWIPTVVPAIFGPELKAYREWLDVSTLGSLGGSMDAADISDYYVTPYDIGYGRPVRFDHDFLGRDALERVADGPHRAKGTLVWSPDDVAAAVRSLCEPGDPAKFIEWPKARYAFFQVDQVLRDGAVAGLSLDLGYIANERAFVSLATVDAAASAAGTQVTVLWGEEPNSAKPGARNTLSTPRPGPAPLARARSAGPGISGMLANDPQASSAR